MKTVDSSRMKKYTKYVIICVCGLVINFTTATFFAQQGYYSVDAARGGFSGPGFIAGSGSGTTTEATVRQAALLPNNNQVLLTGNIVHSIGGHKYFFRDSSGDAIIMIKPEKWAGLSVAPDDIVELFGQLKRDKKNQQLFYIDVKDLKKK